METILQQAFWIYLVISGVLLIIYLPRIYYYVEGFKTPKRFVNKTKNKLAVIVPARNESVIIRDVLNSLVTQTYPKDKYDIYVVVNDKKDPTIAITKTYENTKVFIVPDQKGKGDALDGALKNILKTNVDQYGAFVIIDADNIATPSFLEELNNGLASGRQIVIGKKLLKNHLSTNKKHRNFVSNATGLTFTFVDDMGNAHRSKKNVPLNLCGTGMLITTDVIKELGGWPYRTLIEDFELMIGCTLKGYTSLYYHYAQVYTEQSTSHKIANTRRMRWIAGFAENNKKYRKQIVAKSFENGRFNWKNYDFLYGMFPVYFFFAITVLFGFANLIIAAIYLALQDYSVAYIALLCFIWAFTISYGVVFIYTLIALVIDRKVCKMTLWAKIVVLFLNPLFMSEYLYIFIAAFTGLNSREWKEVPRIAIGVDKD
jgi:cellulose synthase/poly-beta-1,6-N-acetylglucosamine synthase-like glycosyltransferase